MHLPAPTDKLADCVWLPRILAKARFLLADELPSDYATRFCHPTGVDAQFLRYFQIDRERVLALAKEDDTTAASQFTSLPTATPEQIEAWNKIAINLGRPGYPMAERFPLALASPAYQHLQNRGLHTVFEVLAADEAEPS